MMSWAFWLGLLRGVRDVRVVSAAHMTSIAWQKGFGGLDTLVTKQFSWDSLGSAGFDYKIKPILGAMGPWGDESASLTVKYPVYRPSDNS